jgi:threonine/homoserine/homoserine lactone efflux protein
MARTIVQDLDCAITITSSAKPRHRTQMTLDQAAAFLLFALVAAITPGPSNVMVTATGSAVGLMRGLPCAFGAAAGMAVLLFCAALGLGQAVAASPGLLRALNWAGAAFLLWLAWRVATSGLAADGRAIRPAGFVRAALFQWVNPKGWLVAAGAASAYLTAAADRPVTQAVMLGALFFAAAFPACVAWLALGAFLNRLLRDERTARLFNLAMGLALAASVVLILR